MLLKQTPSVWLQARQTAQQKQQAAEESRKEYVTSLNQFNQDQHQHYHTLVPVIYQVNPPVSDHHQISSKVEHW